MYTASLVYAMAKKYSGKSETNFIHLLQVKYEKVNTAGKSKCHSSIKLGT